MLIHSALCPRNGISPYVRTSPEDTFVAGTFKPVRCCISLRRLCVFLFLGEEPFMVWIKNWIISASLHCSFNQSRTLFSPFSFSVTLQLKHWWGRSWNLGAEEPLAHSHISFSLPHRRSIGRPIISGKHYSKARNTPSFPQCYIHK